MRSMMAGLFIVLLLSSAVRAEVTADDLVFSSSSEQALYYELIYELRCPKCQNQTIADSNAPLAQDLRQRTYEMVSGGQSKQQVLDYMVARYGDFVHYQPPMTLATSVLWWGPILAVLIGLGAIILKTRRQATVSLTAAEQAALQQMLKDNPQEQHDDR